MSRFQVLVDEFSLVQRLESNNYLDEDVAQKVNQVLRVLVDARITVELEFWVQKLDEREKIDPLCLLKH